MPSRTDGDALELESTITDDGKRPIVGIDPARVEELVKPIDDWVLVRMDPPLKSSRGGILIGADSVPESRVGVIVSQGDGFLLPNGSGRSLMNAEVGDRVLVERRAGKTMPGVRDETDAATGKLGYLLIRNGSIVCVIRRVAREVRAEPGDKLPQLELAPGDIEPCGDWTLVRTDRPQQEHAFRPAKGLAVPKFLLPDLQKARQANKTDTWSGVVVRAGPGRLAEDGVKRAEVRAKRGARVLYEVNNPLNQTIPTIDAHVLILDREVVPALLLGP